MAEPAELSVVARYYNFSGKPYKSVQVSGFDFRSTFFIAVCCFIILENALVILTIWRTKDFHKPIYYLIGSQSLSDLLAGAAYMSNILLSGAVTYTLTPTEWFLRESSTFVPLSASVFCLLVIAVERYVTMHKMQLHNKKNACQVFLVIGACWFIAIVMGMLPTMGWNCIGNLASCSTVLPLYSKSYIIFYITTFSVVLITIISLYVRIYVLVRRRCRDLVFHTASSGCGRRASEKSLALLKVVVIILSVFIACWMPLFVLLLLDVACDGTTCPILYEEDWFMILAVLHSAMNPIIYTCTSKEMRVAFLTMLPCSCGARNAEGPIIAAESSHSKPDSSQINNN